MSEAELNCEHFSKLFVLATGGYWLHGPKGWKFLRQNSWLFNSLQRAKSWRKTFRETYAVTVHAVTCIAAQLTNQECIMSSWVKQKWHASLVIHLSRLLFCLLVVYSKYGFCIKPMTSFVVWNRNWDWNKWCIPLCISPYFPLLCKGLVVLICYTVPCKLF